MRAKRTSSPGSGGPAPVTSSDSRSRCSPASRAKNSRRPTGALTTPRWMGREGEPGEVYGPPGGRSTRRASRVHEAAHRRDRFGHPGEHGAAHDAVADVELLEVGDRRDRGHVLVGEAVSRVHREAEAPGVPRHPHQLLEGLRIGAPAVSVPTGVELDRGHAEPRGGIDRGGAGGCGRASGSRGSRRERSSPPSVVTSSRRSGTRVAWYGRSRQTTATTSGASASSGVWNDRTVGGTGSTSPPVVRV